MFKLHFFRDYQTIHYTRCFTRSVKLFVRCFLICDNLPATKVRQN